MSKSPAKNYELSHPRPKHFKEIQALCLKVYPFSKPWSIEQLESHQNIFPDGQLIVIDKNTDKLIGLAFSLIISWDDYSHQDNWKDFTASGFFTNHNPQRGRTLYGAEVMVHPDYRGQGIGKLLYKGRKEIVERYNLRRIRAGARLRGYHKFSDKLKPHEYVQHVIEKKIFDPTLSFQLDQGFAAIDVAKNYLFNDPESLGFAAVIEWLNPKAATSADFLAQKRALKNLVSGDYFVPEFLPRELRRLVRKTTLSLGEVIKEARGESFFRKVEFYRTQLMRTRGKKNQPKLKTLFQEVKKENPRDRFPLAHAFALQLELVNCCEAAYRTWRIRQRQTAADLKSKSDIVFVLTAHPTEARSTETVNWLNQVTHLLIEALDNHFFFDNRKLESLLRLLWHTPLGKSHAPTVVDEAEYVFELALSQKSLNFLLGEHPNFELRVQTWVGGDKDGHPGVDVNVMLGCLQSSRSRLILAIEKLLDGLIHDAEILHSSNRASRPTILNLKLLQRNLDRFRRIDDGDGNRVKAWVMKLSALCKKIEPVLAKHHDCIALQKLVKLFPALVLTIELREDASLIEKGLTDKTSAIRKMLSKLGKIAGALEINKYSHSLVISHCESHQDIQNACDLIWLSTKRRSLPVVPLFETGEALRSADKILEGWLQKALNRELVKTHWKQRFEIMLGYSDSAKQIGVLPSRFLISKSMAAVEQLFKKHSIVPIFFHGSGGSIARGGGSLKEQTSWWTKSAVVSPKLTVQGEMIQRWFATKEILNSQCAHFSNELRYRRTKRKMPQKTGTLERFALSVEKKYRSLTENSDLVTDLLSATPYKYLDVLKIGSRPAKRAADKVSLSALRAIPWALCWTQSRSLLPTWWGVGSAWSELSESEKNQLRHTYQNNAVFSSYVKALGFTLEKVELNVWKLYHEQVNNSEKLFGKIQSEYDLTLIFFREITGETSLIWYRPWLEESIRLRAPHVHILNFLQLIAMEENDDKLMRETLVGIACGMLTTG